jgi:hypothetical protein
MAPFGFGGKTADDESWFAIAQDILPEVKAVHEVIETTALSVLRTPLYPSDVATTVLHTWDEMKDVVNDVQNQLKVVGSPAKISRWASADNDLKSFVKWMGSASKSANSYLKAVQGGVGERARYETGLHQKAANARMALYSSKFLVSTADGLPHAVKFIKAMEE